MIPPIKCLKQANPKTETRQWSSEAGVWGLKRIADGYRVSFWVNENVLKLTVVMGTQFYEY